jgi:hypothetical protein
VIDICIDPTEKPTSARRNTSMTTLMNVTPTTAPARLCMPPITSIATIRNVWFKKKFAMDTVPMKWANSTPANPATKPDSVKAIRRDQ